MYMVYFKDYDIASASICRNGLIEIQFDISAVHFNLQIK